MASQDIQRDQSRRRDAFQESQRAISGPTRLDPTGGVGDLLPFDRPLFQRGHSMWVAFPMIRLNMAPHSVPIPDTDEVIPAGTFAAYNTTEVHFNPELYPDPYKYDPDRFREGREEVKKEAYSFVGWGQGRHPCMGMRWAKIQLNIILAYALAIRGMSKVQCH
ncbi:hypothetical protein EYZ11_001186 [Aspergillus tanneri]|uniref:Cytochrome P450 n=1 Tax=Aspergillus tanneri TaxID=1220188 RepID=A0A4S3JVB6_9EURO|nr:hypothetical protein EYZ11_001186 [Aspergillus tanneri]